MSGNTEEDDGRITNPDNLSVIRIKCSDCGKNLSEYAVTSPNSPENWKIKVLCPYCKDHSYTINIKGKFYIAPDDNLVYIDTEMVNDVMVFKTAIK